MNLSNLSPSTQKLIVGAALFGAWTYLVVTGKVAPTDYVENIKMALGGLGLYHVMTPKAVAPSATTVANNASTPAQ